MCACKHVCMHEGKLMCMHVRVCVRVCVCVCACMRACMRVCAYACVCVQLHKYVYSHIIHMKVSMYICVVLRHGGCPQISISTKCLSIFHEG